MADDDHSLLLLDLLDTIEIRSHCVELERVHSFEELNEKKFRKLFDFQSKQYCLFCLYCLLCLRHGKWHSQQTTAANTKHGRLAYHVLYVVNT